MKFTYLARSQSVNSSEGLEVFCLELGEGFKENEGNGISTEQESFELVFGEGKEEKTIEKSFLNDANVFKITSQNFEKINSAGLKSWILAKELE